MLEFYNWLYMTVSKVMLKLRGELFQRYTEVGSNKLIERSLDVCHIALKRVATFWTPGQPMKSTENMILHLSSEADTYRLLGKGEQGFLSEYAIKLVFEYLAVDPEDRFRDVEDLAGWPSLSNDVTLFTNVKGYLNLDTYAVPDVGLHPSSSFLQCFNSYCNADLRDMTGREELAKFKFHSFNGHSGEEDFKAGIIFLHVNKVSTLSSATHLYSLISLANDQSASFIFFADLDWEPGVRGVGLLEGEWSLSHGARFGDPRSHS
jgi:hypothetical protein